MRNRLLILTVILPLVSACAGGRMPTTLPEPTLRPQAEATDTPSPEPTAVPSPAPEPTNTPLPEPTAAPVSFLDSGQRLGSGRSWDVSLGDLDGDGDLDAFVANGPRGDVSNEVWLNDGHGTFVISEQDLGYGMGIDVGDLDGDGDLDVFVASWDEPCRVWLNDSSATFVDTGQSLGVAGGWDVALGDLDGDGDLDGFVGQEGPNRVWLNDGAGVFSATEQQLGAGFTAAIALGDLDSDGDLDGLTVGWQEPGTVWLNDGTGTFTGSDQTLTPSYTHVHGMAIGDLDGDGDLDAFMGHPGVRQRVWLNNGAGIFVDNEQRLPSLAGSDVALGDVDGDGDLDAFMAVGDWTGSDDVLWLNDGRGLFVDSGLPLGGGFSAGVELGDLDGDGDLDAFVAHGELGLDSGGGIPNTVWLNGAASGGAIPDVPSLGDTQIRPLDGMVMVYVPAGEFELGSDDGEVDAALEMCNAQLGSCQREWFEVEQPVHTVVLDSFWIDRTEVTNAQYRECVEAGACDPPAEPSSDTRDTYYGDSAFDAYPVVHVDWHRASAYCEWAGGRLPAEAEWEYAACGPEGRTYPWGDEYDGARLNSCDVNCGYSWAEGAFDDGYGDTAPAGSYPDGASWCGALDIAGNAWEWMADWFNDRYPSSRQVNPAGPDSGTSRTVRGDAADGNRATSRCAARHGMHPARTYEYTGFRCVSPVSP